MSAFAGFRFPPEVIVVAVRWYLRFNLSYRDVEELLVERGVEVDHVTRLPVGATVHAAAGRRRPVRPPLAGDGGSSTRRTSRSTACGGYVYRAVDQYGQVIDVLSRPAGTPTQPAGSSDERCRTLKVTPTEVVTDAAAVYPAVLTS